MLRNNRVHKKDIQIRGVIGYNDIGSFWKLPVYNFLNGIKTAYPHHITPKDEQGKAVILCFRGLDDPPKNRK